jgi:hypothetical protein
MILGKKDFISFMLAGFIGAAATYFFDYKKKERNLIVNVEQKEIYD